MRGRELSRVFLAALLALSAVLANAGGAGAYAFARKAARQAGVDDAAGAAGFVKVALPTDGELSVENRRGGVRVEVWSESQVAVAADVRGQKPSARRRLPVNVERVENSLKISVERATTANAPRVDLTLRVPASARLKIYTSDGEVEVSGVPASLFAQTLSGDLRLALPVPLDASLTAQSLNGSVALGEGVEAEGSAARVLRGKFETRRGAAGHSVNLFSGRGRISLETLAAGAESFESARGVEVKTARGVEAGRVGARAPRVKETPDEGPATNAQQPKPQPTETPQEVDEDEVVRVESDLVTLNVSVIDRASGRGLAGLAAGDFRIYEDNVEQHIEHFESAEAPFDLLLLLDLSGSTARVTETIRAAARRFVAVTRPQDRIAVITFAGEAVVVSPLTSDRAALRERIDRLAPPKGDTRLHDSLAYALDYLTRGADPARRRALILMSDGLDSTLPNVTGAGSRIPYEEIRNRVQEFDGVVYTVWTNTEYYEAFSPQDIQPETYDLAHDRLRELADAGGGVFYEVEKLEDLAGAYERVVADLGTVYSLSYNPSNKRRDGGWRAIRVRLPRRPDAVARGRRGYNAK
ncbi:MAG: Ca-activated chloride channel [Acidobacteriota bacterium]|jgi:VWFA-related protein|nr:Ca-activated chloride channel [Acidobacteriota bacterium]